MAEREGPKHDTVMDVTAERLARVYAEAFWRVALKQHDVSAAVNELQSVVSEVLDKYPALEATLVSALVEQSEKEQIIDRIFAKVLSPSVLNFLKVLSAHDRLGILRMAIKQIKSLERAQLGRVEVEIQVADPLDESIRSELFDALRNRLGRDPEMQVTVDPGLVGGIVIKVGDKVYDGSLRTRFELARKSIIARAIDKIQTNREQFVQPAT